MPRTHTQTTLSLLTLLHLFCPLEAKGCRNVSCGNGSVKVSYPFALQNDNGCQPFSPFFRLNCDAEASKLFIRNIVTSTFNNTDGTFLSVNETLLEVTHITSDSLVVDVGRLRANLTPAADSTSCGVAVQSNIYLPPYPGPFVISNDNQFGASNCTYGSYRTALIAPNESSPVPPGPYDYYNFTYTDLESCNCAASCVMNPHGGPAFRSVTLNSRNFRHAFQLVQDQYYFYVSVNSCSAPHGGFGTFFHRDYTDDFARGPYLLKLKWALPASNESTDKQIKSSFDYACSPKNSILIRVEDVPGYLCSCAPGYTGDGYLNGSGCNDINECVEGTHNCIYGCQNVIGNYSCSCKGLFYGGDGRINGSGCRFLHSVKVGLTIGSSIVGLCVIIGGFALLALWWEQRTKRKFFLQNGGLQMQKYLRTRPGRSEMTRFFKSEELRAATNNYAEDMKLGEGGFGVVFQGKLNDGRLVAIKKAKIMGNIDAAENRQALNEMTILTQINHRHIVRLLGFCLETEAPLLVYEYVSNGNLADSLEAKAGRNVVLSWEQRLKVAQQTAEALAYLHAAASPPILHRDVKSSNVLLDGNLDAKVSDFGVSRLVPEGVKQVSTAVQGTIGYLDPEYFQTLQLTDKSDVYSLGVVLVELITSLKPVDNRNREPGFANLALLFLHRVEEDKLEELIDARLTAETSGTEATWRLYSSIISVAALARECLALEGARRPSMSQVVDELRHISRMLQAPGDEDDDEAAPLLMFSREKALAVEYKGKRVAPVQSIESSTMLHSGSTVFDNLAFSSTTTSSVDATILSSTMAR